jgi:carbon storage regulator CsrA
MLVLTRKTQEKIQIGDNIVLTILRVKGQAVRVGIEAPRDVRVLRSELPSSDEAEAVVTKPEHRPEPAVKLAAQTRAPLAGLMVALHG